MSTPTITRVKLPAIRRAVEATQWAIQREKLLAMIEVIELHAGGGSLSAGEIRARTNDRRPVTKSGGSVAVLPLYGVVSQRMNLMAEFSGGTSTERFSDDFDAAMADPNVSAIVIDCDSPGGNVSGTPELARRIYGARGKGKQIVAVANTLMASAAYWICAAADEVVVTPSGEVGSIGVFCIHLDESGLNEQLGLKYTLISFGEHKTDGNPYEPISDDALAHAQSQVDDIGAMFIADVAKFRGTDAKTVNANFGQGRTFLAKKAVAAGLADRVATLQATLTRLGVKDVGLSGRPRMALGGGPVATIGEDGRPVRPRLAGDGPPDPDEEDLCPECGAPMNDDGSCSGCDYTEPDMQKQGARAGGAAASGNSLSPINRPLEAKEHPVATETAAAPGGADLTTAIAAERTRAAGIRALGKKHRLADDQIDAMVNDGLTVDQAAVRVLSHVEARAGASPVIHVGDTRELTKPFASLGEQIIAIAAESGDEQTRARCQQLGIRRDPRMQAAVSGAGSSLGSDGGFAVQTDFAVDLEKLAFETGVLAAQCSSSEISGNADSLEVTYIDETSRATGSRFGGVQIYRGAEADVATAQKPKFGLWELRLSDLIGLYYATDRLMQDASALSSVVSEAFGQEFGFVLDDEIVNGTGGPKCLGILNSPAKVSVTKDSGQPAATITASNIQNMWIRMPPRWRQQASWYINQEVEASLQNMQIGLGIAGALVYMPPGGLSGVPYGTIYGRPVVPIEQCAAKGTEGDIILFAPPQYKLIRKGGLNSAVSLHVKFTSNEWTFRWIMRVNGAPKLKSAITPYKGTATLSSMVTLATRA